jgi:hypothetical protein
MIPILRRMFVLIGAVGLFAAPGAAVATPLSQDRIALESRVQAVRKALHDGRIAKLESADFAPAQWGNWGNWNKWSNAWNNWSNWLNR